MLFRSQSLEALFCHIPGLKVVYPSNAYDVKGLMASCIRDDNPTMMVLHKRMLGQKGVVPEGRYAIPLGEAKVSREGTDITLVTYGRTHNDCLAAADTLQGEGVSVEVVDLRTLSPLDTNTVLASVAKTHRAIVVHEAVRFGGFGAEVASQIAELAFDDLDAPVGRVTGKDVPMPYAANLEKLALPSTAEVVAAAKAVLYRT